MAHRSIRRRSSKTTATFVELGRATGVFAPGLKLPSGRLNQVRHASLRQLWAERAARLGWDAMALFGCAPKRPLDYFGSAGLLWAINGGRLVELHRDWAVIDVPVLRSKRISGLRPVCRKLPSLRGKSPLLRGFADFYQRFFGETPSQKRQRLAGIHAEVVQRTIATG